MSGQGLDAIAGEGQPPREVPDVPERVRRFLQTVGPEHGDGELANLVEALVRSGNAADVAAELARDAGPLPRQLAMLLAGRIPAPWDRGLVAALRPLLRERRVPVAAQFELAAGFLRTTGPQGHDATAVLGALVSGLGKREAVERLEAFARRAGPAPAVEQLAARLDNLIKITCPRCSVRLPRREMVKHLWLEHKLLLDRQRVREPWKLIEDWIDAYYLDGDAELLVRCRDLARRIDPADGIRRVQQLLLASGVDDPEARRTLLAEAGLRRASVCPRCYALVPPREDPPARPLNVSHGRLTGHGYRVEVSRRGWFSRLEIESPAGLRRGHEPGRLLTPQGATVVLAGPLVLLAFILLFVLGSRHVPPLTPVLLVLGAAALAGALAQVEWRWRRPPVDRAVDYAWTLLAPLLHADRFVAEDSAFLAGLALSSIGRGSAEARRSILHRVRNYTEKAVSAGLAPVTHLAALWRLVVEDEAAGGEDPVPVLVNQVARCFEGKLPLDFADQLLRGVEQAWWSGDHRAGLRVLLADRAFEAGFEVEDLVEAGRIAPALATALRADEPEELAELRLLWSLRPGRPWDDCGPADTAFQLAAEPGTGRDMLEAYPDLLLAAREQPRVYLCGRGLVFQGVVFPEPINVVEVKGKGLFKRGGHTLILGDEEFEFRNDPTDLADRLQRWFRFYFKEFVPRVAGVYDWRVRVAAVLHAQELVKCPECHRRLLLRPGEMGLLVDSP